MPGGLTKQELDEQFELFLKEPVSDDSVEFSSADTKSRTQEDRGAAASCYRGHEGAPQGSCTGSGPARGPQPLRRALEAVLPGRSHKEAHVEDGGGLCSSGSVSSLTRRSEDRRSPAASSSPRSDRDGAAGGVDTLEEEEEKTRFFAKLQAEVSSPCDYSKLIGELDSTGSPTGRSLGQRKFEEAASDDNPMKESQRGCPAVAGSSQYSDDFEDEEQVSKASEVLAEDPLDDPLGSSTEDRRVDAGLHGGQVNVQSGGLEMEAVHEAYRLIQQQSDGDYQGGGANSRAESLVFPSQHVRESLQRTSTLESDFCTAEELMKPICPEKEVHVPSLTDGRMQMDTAVHRDGEKRRHIPEDTFYVETGSELQPKLWGQTEPLTEPPIPTQSQSIRGQVDRLMQHHHTGSSHTWRLDPEAARHPCHSPTSSSKRPSVRGRRGEGRASVAQRMHTPLPQQTENKEEDAGPAEASGVVVQQQKEPSRHHRAADTPARQRPSTSLWSAAEATEKVRSVRFTDSAAEETFQQMQKEIKEQETLIKGYQQENEKLYLQLKTEKFRSRAKEDAMLEENQRLLSQLAFSSASSVDHPERTPDLLAEISRLQRDETRLCEDVDRLKQENQALLAELQRMKKEEAVSAPASGSTARVEASAPKKQQQKMQATDAARLKAASAEIQQLKQQLEKLKVSLAKRSTDHQRRAREKSAEAKRMQELERQVRQLQQLLGNRQSTAEGQGDAGAASNSSRSINVLLELKIQRLEAELENHNQEAKRSFQAMEQHFHTVKVRYEQHIWELQQQLEAAGLHGPRAEVQALEEELQCVKTGHQERERSLQDVIDALQQQLKHKAHSSPGRHERHAEVAFGVRIERLNQELSAKTRTIQELSRSVDRLQKEKRNTLTSCSHQPHRDHHRPETRPQPGAAQEAFPAAGCQKTYKPTVFADTHISDVLQENEALRQRLELLELFGDQEKEVLKVEAAQAREELLRVQQSSAEQLQLVEQRQEALTLQHSSQVTEWTNKLHTQQITVDVLQEQLKELQEAKDGLEISRRREDALQQQLSRLLVELKEAKDAQSPEVKLLCSLERKLVNMELRHQSREKELQQVIGRSWQTSECDQQSQVERWRRVAEDKRRELDTFRQELDSILDIVRYLQREGVVLPFPAASAAPHVPGGLLNELR